MNTKYSNLFLDFVEGVHSLYLARTKGSNCSIAGKITESEEVASIYRKDDPLTKFLFNSVLARNEEKISDENAKLLVMKIMVFRHINNIEIFKKINDLFLFTHWDGKWLSRQIRQNYCGMSIRDIRYSDIEPITCDNDLNKETNTLCYKLGRILNRRWEISDLVVHNTFTRDVWMDLIYEVGVPKSIAYEIVCDCESVGILKPRQDCLWAYPGDKVRESLEYICFGSLKENSVDFINHLEALRGVYYTVLSEFDTSSFLRDITIHDVVRSLFMFRKYIKIFTNLQERGLKK